MEFEHITVLKNETIDGVYVRDGGLYVDMTLGGGGHSEEILSRGGRVVGIDQDSEAINAANERLTQYGDRFRAVQGNFKDISDILKRLGVGKVDGIVADLGVSSYQLDEAERGFSYMHDAPLDMRMCKENTLTAKIIVNTYSKEEICRIISEYGEERWAKRIAEFIAQAREQKELETTGELVSVIKAAVPKDARRDGPHPAKRTFQALRIEVNGELTILGDAVRNAVNALSKGGRIGIITFHSLEDRIVKNVYNEMKIGCTCPKDFPVCVCGGKASVKIISKKPVVPSENEIECNPRSRSAKLRIAEKII